jgi:hypothetical protein
MSKKLMNYISQLSMIEDSSLWRIVKKSDELILLKENSIKEKILLSVKKKVK